MTDADTKARPPTTRTRMTGSIRVSCIVVTSIQCGRDEPSIAGRCVRSALPRDGGRQASQWSQSQSVHPFLRTCSPDLSRAISRFHPVPDALNAACCVASALEYIRPSRCESRYLKMPRAVPLLDGPRRAMDSKRPNKVPASRRPGASGRGAGVGGYLAASLRICWPMASASLTGTALPICLAMLEWVP